MGFVDIEIGDVDVPEPARHELGRGGLVQENVDNIITVKTSALAQHRLGAAIMVPRIELEFEIPHLVITITCQGAGHFLDRRFGVIPFAQDKQFHQLARQVLVRLFLAAAVVVQIVQHRRITHHRLRQITETAVAQFAEGPVLASHGVHLFLHTGIGGDKMVVPQQDQPFCLWVRGGDHFAHPPVTQFPHFLISGDAKGLAVFLFVIPTDPVVRQRR